MPERPLGEGETMSDKKHEQADQPGAAAETPTVKADHRTARELPERVRDDRQVHSGVMLPHADGVKVYADTPGDIDALEDILTPQQHARLARLGVLSGDWRPRGKTIPAMAGSRHVRDAERAAGAAAIQAAADESLRRENAELRHRLEAQEARLARLERDRGESPPAREDAAGAPAAPAEDEADTHRRGRHKRAE
jgi:hypothetical protein